MVKGKLKNLIPLPFYLDISNFFMRLGTYYIKEYNFLWMEKNEIQYPSVSQKSVLIFLIKLVSLLKVTMSLYLQSSLFIQLLGFFPLSLSEVVNVDTVWHFAQTASNHKPENRMWPLTV